jgi:hypothetical protein
MHWPFKGKKIDQIYSWNAILKVLFLDVIFDKKIISFIYM